MTQSHTHAADPDARHANSADRRIVVVGGGLAGIAAALRLAEAGVAVTLVESRKRLGGRATSFVDPDTGEVLDNCQHVVMRSCTNLLDLYERLGVEDRFRWERAIHFINAAGHIDTLEPDDLPAPLHLMRPMFRLQNLTASEKWAIAKAMLAILQTNPRSRSRHADETFADWLNVHRQPAGAIEKFWAPIITSACNETPDRVAASHALHVFQEGFLFDDSASEMGLATVPLVELYDSVEQRLRAVGGEVLTGASAERFDFAHGQIKALRLTDGQELTADAYIAALPFDRLAKLTDDAMAHADPRLARLNDFEVSPILGIHLFLRRPDGQPVLTLPHLAFMQSPLHWIFNKGLGRRHRDENGAPVDRVQHLHGVISAAHDWVDQPADAIRDMALAELRKVLPAARDAELVHARVIKEKRATFSPRPGSDALRPAAAGPMANLYLAGDWTDTGWPATMESATRSGYLAAFAAMDALHIQPHGDPVTNTPPTLLYRLLSG
ncbi:MAG: hydroxysqualene dehydroxylase HpnE [Phycisphaeraceae bacterium]